jgi:hypothetical protein
MGYVGNGFGGSGHLLYQPDGTGIFALWMDLGFVNCGRETKRVPFSSTVGGRVSVNVTRMQSRDGSARWRGGPRC